MKIAVMQPYFVPYGNYFRLFSETDLFVVYDDVQHIRRGWIHRNRLPVNGKLQWLTLPLKHQPRETAIMDIEFATNADQEFRHRLVPFGPQAIDLRIGGGTYLLEYLLRTLKDCATQLGIAWNVVRSSALAIDPQYRGQDRILAICKRLGATHYLNAPGGRLLYEQADFAHAGITLEFLPDWTGPMESVLCSLAQKERMAA